MKHIKHWFLSGLLLLGVSVAFSQGKITGIIIDSDMNAPLPGANVMIKGTSLGTSTDFDGKFSISATTSSGELVVSFLGYDNKTVAFHIKDGISTHLGKIVLESNSNLLDDVVITGGIADIAQDRKTPVAVSTIKASEIQAKLGNQEFPEILKNTPSVYVTKSGGGFGDSRINIRGFDQKNIAVMVNGMPINDMETSSVYWSNWSGLSDVTTAMQVQRGLGSSKLAISSVGGTINILTRTAEMKEGGTVSTDVGNDGYAKFLGTYSTGKMENGLSASVLFSRTSGDGYVDGTQFESYNYFVGLGYEINEKHNLQFTFTGAPQSHNQRTTAPTINDYLKYSKNGDPNIKYNSDWGYLNGKEFGMRSNYYHKPVMSLNWDWEINETTKLSSVFYASWGRGGGANGTGSIRGNRYFSSSLKTADGIIDMDKIQQYNSGQQVDINGVPVTRSQIDGQFRNDSGSGNTTTNGISQISSINSHNWYGGVINLNNKLTENLMLDFGVDLRTYKGMHYQNVNNLFGGNVYFDNNDVNNPNRLLYNTYSVKPSANPFLDVSNHQRVGFNNDGVVNWYGGFVQLEYANDNLTTFVQGALSNQAFQRIDHFIYLKSDPLSKTDFENILGGNVKGGANYNINENHNVFANIGYYSKQPFFNAVYPNNASVVNKNLTNEKIFGVELGYGFRSEKFNTNLNLYRTSWKDRFIKVTALIDDDLNPATDPILGTAFLEGVEQIHMGIEVDFVYKPIDRLSINGMFSIGNWKYGGNVTANYTTDNNVVITNPDGTPYTETLYLDGIKVGDAAQMTAAIGATYEVFTRFKVDANYNFADKLYAALDPQTLRTVESNKQGTLELPSYGIFDAGISYKIFVGRSDALNIRANMNNVFDKIYIAESRTNIHATPGSNLYDGIDTTNQVFFGFGRTWNLSLRYEF